MRRRSPALLALSAAVVVLLAGRQAAADPVVYSNLTVLGTLGAAARIDSPAGIEIETGDDFVLTQATAITKATFIGLTPTGSTVNDLVVEMYRVFPNDSTDPPDGKVPTRKNSPADVAFDSRSKSSGISNITETQLNPSFTAQNSVVDGIFPSPNNVTKGEGPVSGQEVQFTVTFGSPFVLQPGQYFFVPQLLLDSGNFLWLSASRPVSEPAGFTDLQAWIRNEDLDPNWLRIGTDIIDGVHSPTFNMAFELEGTPIPEPTSLVLLSVGLIAASGQLRRRLRNKRKQD